MNLYNWLKFDDPELVWDEPHKMNERQIEFCNKLMKDVPELVDWSPSHPTRGGKRLKECIKLFKCRSSYYIDPEVGRVTVGVTVDEDGTNSYLNIFQIQDRPIDEWTPNWDSDHHCLWTNYSWDQEKDLRPIVKEWCIGYERNIQRKYKLKRIVE